MFNSKPTILTTADQDLFVCPVGVDGAIHGLVLSNTTGGAVSYTLKFYDQDTGTTTTLVNAKSMAAGEIYTFPKPLNVRPGDKLIMAASANASIVAFYSVFLDTASTYVSAFVARGVYSAATSYNPGDLVTYSLNTYIAIQTALNQQPDTATAYWMPLGLGTKASAADIRVGTNDTNFFTPKALYDASAFVALTDAATIALDLNTALNFSVTLAGNRTLGAPTNAKPGQTGVILIKQDATGSRTLAYNAAYRFFGSTPSLTTTANAVDMLTYIVDATGVVRLSLTKGATS